IDKTYPKLRKNIKNKELEYLKAEENEKQKAKKIAKEALKSKLEDPDSLKINNIETINQRIVIKVNINYQAKNSYGIYVNDFYTEIIPLDSNFTKLSFEYEILKNKYNFKISKIFGEDSYNIFGYNEAGYDRKGYNKFGYNKEGYNSDGYNNIGFNKKGKFDGKSRYSDAKIEVNYENIYNDFGEKTGKKVKSIIIGSKRRCVKLMKSDYGNILGVISNSDSNAKVSYIKAYVNNKKILQKKYSSEKELRNDFIYLFNKYPKLDMEVCKKYMIFKEKVVKIKNINTKKYRKIINEFKD
ncbi:MAG: hypothetical protein Q7K48_07425, partial [Fusobacterium sp. JB021]|nr:hypothetical protein [Fusobacterium sp. JB021]